MAMLGCGVNYLDDLVGVNCSRSSPHLTPATLCIQWPSGLQPGLNSSEIYTCTAAAGPCGGISIDSSEKIEMAEKRGWQYGRDRLPSTFEGHQPRE